MKHKSYQQGKLTKRPIKRLTEMHIESTCACKIYEVAWLSSIKIDNFGTRNMLAMKYWVLYILFYLYLKAVRR